MDPFRILLPSSVPELKKKMGNKKKKKDGKKKDGGCRKSESSKSSSNSKEPESYTSALIRQATASSSGAIPSIPPLSSEADEYLVALVRDYVVRQSLPLSLLVYRCFRNRALYPPPQAWFEQLDPELPAELRDGFLLCSLAGLTRAYLEPLAAQTMGAIRAELEGRQLFVVLSSFQANGVAEYGAIMAGILGEDDGAKEGEAVPPRIYLLKVVPVTGMTPTKATEATVNAFFDSMVIFRTCVYFN